MLRVMFLAILTASAWSAQADEVSMLKYRDFLPQQILNLPENIRSSEVPMAYTGAANLALSPAADLILQTNLNELMYDGIGNFEKAKKDFQKDLGEDPTGDLTVWQIFTLGYRADRQNLGSVGFFPFSFNASESENFASLRGTLSILDERIAYPINHVKIDCDKVRGICDYQQFVLMIPDKNSWIQSYSILEMANENYRITRWENGQIDAVPFNTNGCRINQLSFNFSTNEFFEIAKNNQENCELSLGGTLPSLDKPRISQILDGTNIISEEFQKIADEAFGYTSKDFQFRVQDLRRTLEMQK